MVSEKRGGGKLSIPADYGSSSAKLRSIDFKTGIAKPLQFVNQRSSADPERLGRLGPIVIMLPQRCRMACARSPPIAGHRPAMASVGLLRHGLANLVGNASAKSIRCAPAIPPAPSRASSRTLPGHKYCSRHAARFRKARAPFREFRMKWLASGKIPRAFRARGTFNSTTFRR